MPERVSEPVALPYVSDAPMSINLSLNASQFAAEHDAVETLLMSDSIFRVRDFVARRKYVDLVESVSRSMLGWALDSG